MILSRYYLVFPFLYLITVSCASQSDPKPPPSNSSATPSVSSDCQYGIQIFNKMASTSIINEIKEVKRNYGEIPEDLKILYPKAKDAWNHALQTNVYSKEFSCTALSSLPKISQVNIEELQDYQKFFFLLAKYRYGPYPAESRDTLKRLAWIEKADSKTRMENTVKATLISNCHHEFEEVNQLVAPILLPKNVEDCLLAD